MKESFFNNPQQEKEGESRAKFENIVSQRVLEIQEDFPEVTKEEYYQLYAHYEDEQREKLTPEEQTSLEDVGSLPERIFDENVHKLIIQRIHLEKLNIDHLTNLPNRKKFDQELKKRVQSINSLATEEHRRSTEKEGSFGMLYLDIDLFKDVNDTYGHDIGDKALTHTAHLLENAIRDEDFIARFGGEEFVILASASQQSEYLQLAEKLRSTIEEHPLQFTLNEKTITLPITISIGVSSPYKAFTETQKLLKDSDTALYVAKGKDIRSNEYTIASQIPEKPRNQIWYTQDDQIYHYEGKEKEIV